MRVVSEVRTRSLHVIRTKHILQSFNPRTRNLTCVATAIIYVLLVILAVLTSYWASKTCKLMLDQLKKKAFDFEG